jgi:AraC family transcriptional regulator, regulatory protein of adaptative response / methylphosphotriester-DNA alkyltransferase methyltransferase
MNEEVWEAIINCDSAYDGKFFYGVDTTKIFCRPSCKSRNPKRENVRVFSSIEEAVSANFRPCKRCRPDHMRWPDEDLVQRVVKLIENRYQEVLTLSNLANVLYVSPYHLHRTFKRVVGQTPADYLRTTRLKAAQKLLTETEKTITDIAIAVGFPNVAHFSTVFQKQFGVAPSAYRSKYDTT